jgi:ankyrin repeat protein
MGVVRHLASIGVDMQRTDRRGFSPFHAACQEGHLDVARFLAHTLDDHLNPNQVRADACSLYPLLRPRLPVRFLSVPPFRLWPRPCPVRVVYLHSNLGGDT